MFMSEMTTQLVWTLIHTPVFYLVWTLIHTPVFYLVWTLIHTPVFSSYRLRLHIKRNKS